MNDLEDLKRKWQQIDITAGTDGGIPDMPGHRHLTSSIKQRIIRRSLRMLAVMGVGLLMAPEFSDSLHAPTWFMICYIAYFVLAAILNVFMILRIKRFDFAGATAIEAIDFVTSFTTLRNNIRMLLICIAAPLIALMFWVIDHGNEPLLLCAGFCGALIGTALGILINRRFKNELALLKKHLEGECVSEKDSCQHN